jgi:hypothetical protein
MGMVDLPVSVGGWESVPVGLEDEEETRDGGTLMEDPVVETDE